MNSPDFPGRELFRVSGRVLVWVEVADVHYYPEDRQTSIPLFTDDDIDSGRFLVEMDGWLSILEGTEYRLHETGEPFVSLQLPDRIHSGKSVNGNRLPLLRGPVIPSPHSHFKKLPPIQFVFELLKVATPIPESQRVSLMGDAEIAFSKLGKPKEDGAEVSKIEAQAAEILKSWWFQTLLAISFIWAKREVIDYAQGGSPDDDDDDDDDDN